MRGFRKVAAGACGALLVLVAVPGSEALGRQPAGVPRPAHRGPLRAGAPAGRPDFDGDGSPDAVQGQPSATVGSAPEAGRVLVSYGGGRGGRELRQGGGGLPERADPGDRFGARLLTADLDADGFTDLVVGAPGEGWDHRAHAGRSLVLWGGPRGLGAPVLLGRPGGPVAGDGFAFTAVGDVNGDGFPDLVGTASAAGRADTGVVLYGPFRRWMRAAGSAPFGPPGDGTVRLEDPVVGDFDGDGAADLAVLRNDDDEAKSLVVFRGGPGGLRGRGEVLPVRVPWSGVLAPARAGRGGLPGVVVSGADGTAAVLRGRRGDGLVPTPQLM